jgi:hypothetical protein
MYEGPLTTLRILRSRAPTAARTHLSSCRVISPWDESISIRTYQYSHEAFPFRASSHGFLDGWAQGCCCCRCWVCRGTCMVCATRHRITCLWLTDPSFSRWWSVFGNPGAGTPSWAKAPSWVKTFVASGPAGSEPPPPSTRQSRGGEDIGGGISVVQPRSTIPVPRSPGSARATPSSQSSSSGYNWGSGKRLGNN